jgi:hypothetical protein
MTLSSPRRRILAISAASVLVVSPVFAARQKKDDKKLQEAQQKEIQALVKQVDAMAAGQPGPSDFPIQFQNDFLKALEGRTYVPFTLTIDPAKLPPQPVAMYLRAVPRGETAAAAPAPPPPADKDRKKDDKDKDDKDKKDDKASQYPFEDVHFVDLKAPEQGQPIRLSRALSVPGGEYDVYVAIKERTPADGKSTAPPKTSILKQPLTVPNYWNGDLNTSTLILADKVDPVTTPVDASQQTERPYVLGNMEIVPAADQKFGKGEELQLLLLIYNTGISPEGKPDIEVEYTFHQKTAEGEKYFNRTEPQKFNAQSLPANFDVKAGHQVVAGQGIPLKIFPEGDYRLEVKITDKIAGKTLMREAAFTVVGP